MAGFKKEKKEFLEELLQIARVTRVTSWGRQLRFRATVVVWNKKWKVWVWTGKAWEVVDAIAKAVRDAKKNLVNISIKDWTIWHDVKAKYKSASLFLHPASEWTWIIAWGAPRKVLSVSWISNIISKRYWSTNVINNARATIKALESIRD